MRNHSLAKAQVKADWVGTSGDTYGVQHDDIKSKSFKMSFLNSKDFDDKGIVRLIVEAANFNESCSGNTAECFIEALLMDENNKVIVSGKVNVEFSSIKSYYTHMTAGTASPSSEGEFVKPEPFSAVHVAQKRIIEDVKDITYDQNIVFVHGWRMPFQERVQFAETAFKRLYWQGFKGHFIFCSWPTGWFEFPAYISDTERLYRLSAYPQNYDNSEAIARRTGPLLKDYLENLPASKTRIFAHSMGNVVVSEALRSASAQVVSSYVASQAAEVAGAYDFNVPNMTVRGRDFNYTWEISNSNEFGIPPDRYRTTIESAHGPGLEGIELVPLYNGISSNAGRIINFNNISDAALSGWRLNQVLKPAGTGIAMSLSPNDTKWLYKYNPVNANLQTESITDVFHIDPPGLLNEFETTWNEINPTFGPAGIGNPEYLAHILPGRTAPFGQLGNTKGEVVGAVDLSSPPYNYKASNFDHSAQFLGANAGRNTCYWSTLLDTLFNIRISRDWEDCQ